MSAELADWLAGERRRRWSLVTLDDGTPDFFEDLARRSEPHIPDTHLPFLPKWNANSAFTPSSSVEYFCLPEALSEEWLNYRTRWAIFLQANPRLRLAWLLGRISESHDATSWPYAWSTQVRDWVLSGFETPRPYNDHDRIDTPALRADLHAISRRGWVVWADDDRYAWEPRDGPDAALEVLARVPRTPPDPGDEMPGPLPEDDTN